jgi:hypothetical protein
MIYSVFELALNLTVNFFAGVGMAFVFILWKTQNMSLWGRPKKYNVMKSELYKCLYAIDAARSAIETDQIIDRDALGTLKRRKAELKLALEFLR